jgi:Flp pilus assembly pilin Flp
MTLANIWKQFRRLTSNDSGGVEIEYLLLASVFIFGTIAGMKSFAIKVNQATTHVADSLSAAVPSVSNGGSGNGGSGNGGGGNGGGGDGGDGGGGNGGHGHGGHGG